MAEQELLPHALTLDGRKRLTMTGVTEVVSFDDTAVLVKTGLGTLLIQGSGLKLKALTPEKGNVTVEGQIGALSYAQPRQGGWLSRLLG